MIHEKTVFILGAGASCHLGYPLGKDLWSKVVEYLALIKDFGKIPKQKSIEEQNRKKNRDLLIDLGFLEASIEEFHNSLSRYGPFSSQFFCEFDLKQAV